MKKYLSASIVSAIIFLFFSSFQLEAQQSVAGTMIKIETSRGDMLVRLYDETPVHRDNMIKLVKEGFYNNQLFHRVIKDFMIQGGDPHSVGAPKGQRLGSGSPGYTLPAEFKPSLIHKKGALAAARKGDRINPEQSSNGSQFYIVQGRVLSPEEIAFMKQQGVATFTEKSEKIYTSLGGTPHLDGAYTVFGELVEGLEVLDSIAAQPCDAYNRPVEDVSFTISLLN